MKQSPNRGRRFSELPSSSTRWESQLLFRRSHMQGGRMERKAASDYPQELLDLFHEYQHGDISRRTFLDRAGKFAVGGLTVAAIFEGLAPNYAWAQQVQPGDKRIKGGYEPAQPPAGNGSIKGYLARPVQGKKLPVVLVIHENRGLNPY